MTPAELLPTATRIADALLEVQHRVNDAGRRGRTPSCCPGCTRLLGTEPAGAVDAR